MDARRQHEETERQEDGHRHDAAPVVLPREAQDAEGEADSEQDAADDDAWQRSQEPYRVGRPTAAEGEWTGTTGADECPGVVGVDAQPGVAVGRAGHLADEARHVHRERREQDQQDDERAHGR